MKISDIRFNNIVFKHMIKALSLIFIILAISNPMFLFMHSQSANPTKILILNSYHKGFPWEDNIVNGIETTFESSDENIELTIEYMDSKNNQYNDTYKQMLYDLYSYKYAQMNFDVVITTDDNALNFLLDYHDDLFPSTPVVFCGVNNLDAPSLVNRSFYTGMLEIIGYYDTVELMLDLHPKTNNIISIMCDTPTGNYAWNQFNITIPLFPEISITRMNTSYLSEEVKSFVGNQDEDTLFLFYSWYRDGNGTLYTLKEGTEFISEACSRPMYGLHAQALPYGVVGGKLLSGTYHGVSTANMVLRILAGESPSEIEIIDEVHAEFMFNYDQLMRWDLKLSDLPEGSVIINMPFSFYQEYKLLIWTVFGIVMSLIVIIVVLVSSITKRKQVEKELVIHQTQLESLVEDRTAKLQTEIDDHEQTSDILEKEKKRLSLTLKSISEGLIAINVNGQITLINEAAERLTGWRNKEAIGKQVEQVLRISNRTNGNDDENPLMEVVLKESKSLELSDNTILITKKGDTRIIGDSVISIKKQNGKICGAVIVFRDITEKRMMEEKIAKQEKLALLGLLVGGIGHELRNPLGSIKNAAYFLKMAIDDKDPEVKETLVILEKEVDASEKIINNLISFTRSKPLIKMKVNINEIIKTALTRVKVPDTIKIETRLSAKLPPVFADSNQLIQVFINIINNGIQAIEKEGELIIKTSKKDSESILIEISDTGIGMSKEVQKRLFEPLYTTKAKGIGLGLVLSKTILEKHNGKIDVTSEVGKGSTVTIDLPIGLSTEG